MIHSQPKDWMGHLLTRSKPNEEDLVRHYGRQEGDTAYEWYGNGVLKCVRTPEVRYIRLSMMPWGVVRSKRHTTSAIAMLGMVMSYCMNGAIANGISHGCEQMNLVEQATTERNFIPTS